MNWIKCLALLLFILLMAAEAFYVQTSAFAVDLLSGLRHTTLRRLLIIDLAMAVLLAVTFRPLAYLAVIIQFFISIFVLSYFKAFALPPTMSALINGYSMFSGANLSLLHYVDRGALPLLSGLIICKLFLLRKAPKISGRKKWLTLIVCGLALAGFHIDDYRTKRFSLTSSGLSEAFDNMALRRMERRGFASVWLQELISGMPEAQRDLYHEAGCAAKRIENLPLPAISSKISIIQVECLDWIALSKSINGQMPAPNLNAMAAQGMVFAMNGIKNLASANSDYELLNRKTALASLLYYAHIADYPDSIIMPFELKGYETAVIHGLEGSYMNLKNVYPKMGFNTLFFAEALREKGYEPRPELFMSQVPDKDLFGFAARLAENKDKFLHFIITVSMHAYHPALASGEKQWPDYYRQLNYTDQAIGDYVNSLSDGSMVVIYGDHRSYHNSEGDGRVPFIIYIKNRVPGSVDNFARPVYSRCEMSEYLARIFRLHLQTDE